MQLYTVIKDTERLDGLPISMMYAENRYLPVPIDAESVIRMNNDKNDDLSRDLSSLSITSVAELLDPSSKKKEAFVDDVSIKTKIVEFFVGIWNRWKDQIIAWTTMSLAVLSGSSIGPMFKYMEGEGVPALVGSSTPLGISHVKFHCFHSCILALPSNVRVSISIGIARNVCSNIQYSANESGLV